MGPTLGTIYANGVNAFANGDHSVLPNTVNLLTSAYGNLTSPNLGAAKNYFADGTTDGMTTAVAPAGFMLPTFNGLPNKTNSVYDIAYGVNNMQASQKSLGNSRPVQVAPPSAAPGPHINLFDPTAISGLTTNPSFPSGHTTYAYTDSILLGMMAPELYQSMLSCASQYANSRIVLGVHYPLDIIGSRSLVSYDLAQAFTNPAYINNAARRARRLICRACSRTQDPSSTASFRPAAAHRSRAARRARAIPSRRPLRTPRPMRRT